MNKGRFFDTFVKTLPVLMGYIPLGGTFGLLFSELNLPWEYAALMALLVYAGAGQFLLVALLAAKAGLFEIAISSFMLNLRHSFYGLSMIKSLEGFSLKRYYIIFGLTDETFALLKTTKTEDESEYLMITFLNHCYWITGCVLGALAGGYLDLQAKGIEFSLTALFVVLSIDLYLHSPSVRPFLIGLVAGIAGLLFFPGNHMLILCLLLTTLFLIINRTLELRHA